MTPAPLALPTSAADWPAWFQERTQSELATAYREISNLERSRLAERRFTSFREFAPWIALQTSLKCLCIAKMFVARNHVGNHATYPSSL